MLATFLLFCMANLSGSIPVDVLHLALGRHFSYILLLTCLAGGYGHEI